MSVLRNLSIRAQLITLLLLVIGLFLVAAAVSYRALDRAKTEFTAFITQDQQLLLNYTELYANGLQMGQALRNIILDPGNPKAYDNFAKANSAMDALLAPTQAMVAGLDEASQAAMAKVAERREKQKGLQQDILNQVRGGAVDTAKQTLNDQETPVWREIRATLLDLIKAQKAAIEAKNADVQASAARAQGVSLALSGLAVVVGLVVGLAILANIVSRLGHLTASIGQLAQGHGDLTARLPAEGRNELSQAAAGFNAFLDGLQTMVNTIKDHARQLDGLSGQLAQSSANMRDSAHMEAEAVASAASSIEEMSASIASVAEGATQVQAVSAQSAGFSSQARANMEQLGSAMNGVRQAVQGVAGSVDEFLRSTQNIIGATQHVKDIADQINLLALNAAIEAARAGEAGRGFAVVADEVRKLAEKTALYANEINQITTELGNRSSQVEASIQAGEAVLETSARCGETAVGIIDQAHGSVLEARAGIERIAATTQEQSLASSEIAANVERLADVAARTDQVIQQSDRTVQEMRRLAEALNGTVSRFRS
ncbi:MAG: methyl-accepting chemotaxis protein [Pseudomonadota bacterium]